MEYEIEDEARLFDDSTWPGGPAGCRQTQGAMGYHGMMSRRSRLRTSQ